MRRRPGASVMAKACRILFGMLPLAAAGFLSTGCAGPQACVWDQIPAPGPMQVTSDASPFPTRAATLAPCDKALPINLPTALELADVQPIDVAVASQRVELAAAQLR